MTPMDRLAAWLRPEDVEPALRLLFLFESHGRIDPREAAEWRRRIVARAQFHRANEETRPSA